MKSRAICSRAVSESERESSPCWPRDRPVSRSRKLLNGPGSDTGAGTGPFFSSSRRPSPLGRCRRIPVPPQGPFTGTAAPSRRKRFCGCRPFRAPGSSKEAIVNGSGKPAMPLLLSWRRFLAGRSPRSSLARIFVDAPPCASPVPQRFLRPRLLGPSPPSTWRSRASMLLTRVQGPDQDLGPVDPTDRKAKKKISIQCLPEPRRQCRSNSLRVRGVRSCGVVTSLPHMEVYVAAASGHVSVMRRARESGRSSARRIRSGRPDRLR